MADLSGTDPESLFEFASTKVSSGWTLGKFVKSGLGLTIIGLFIGIQNLFGSIVDFVTNPLDSAGQSIATLFGGLIGKPASILTGTATTTASEISETFTGFLGVLAFPAGVASVMLGLYVVTLYLDRPDTSDLFPGTFTDIDTPEWVPFLPDPGVQEENEADQAKD